MPRNQVAKILREDFLAQNAYSPYGPKPFTPNRNPKVLILYPKPQNLKPKTQHPNPKPETLNPKPKTLIPKL